MTPARPLQEPGPHLAFEVLRDLRLVVSIQSKENPTDAEWAAWLAAADTLGDAPSGFRLLVMTRGGQPSRAQLSRVSERKRRAEQLLGKRQSEPLTAMISASAASRFLVSALTFMNPAIRCFSPAALGEAYAHLRLTDPERKQVDAAIERLRAVVGADSSGEG